MKRRQKGSLTVEASILMPFILFLLLAGIYLMFFMHDRVIMQSCSLRMAEDILWSENVDQDRTGMKDAHKIPVLMMTIRDVSQNTDNSPAKLMSILKSREKAEINMRGYVEVAIPGSASLTGDTMNAEICGGTVRICYTDDRLKSVFFQRQKEGKD